MVSGYMPAQGLRQKTETGELINYPRVYSSPNATRHLGVQQNLGPSRPWVETVKLWKLDTKIGICWQEDFFGMQPGIPRVPQRGSGLIANMPNGALQDSHRFQGRGLCQRLNRFREAADPFASEHVPSKTKSTLRIGRDDLDPFELHDRLEEGLRRMLHLAGNSSRPTASLRCGPNEALLKWASAS
jgi:hypothetical protein